MFRTRIVLGTFMALMLCMPFTADAAEVRVGERASVGSSEELTENSYLAGGLVDSTGAITGDLMLGGGSISIGGSVSEDIAAGGGNININADTGGDVRVAGGNITIAGAVGGDVAVLGGQTYLSGERIDGDVLWGGGVLSVNTPVGGNMRLAGDEVFINAPIAGNVEFNGAKLILGSNAVIEGTLTYRAPNEVVMEDGAVVRGDISYTETARGKDARKDIGAMLAAFISIAVLVGFLMRFVAALILGLGFRGYTHDVVTSAFSTPWAMLGRGFLAAVAIPVAGIMLLITIIGMPLGFLALAAYAALLIFAGIMAPILLGCLVHKWMTKADDYVVSWKSILLGVVLFMVLGLIPVLGWIVQCIIVLMTIGAVTKIKWDIAQNYLRT